MHFHTHYAGPIAKPHLVTVHGNLPPAGATADCVFVSRNHAQRFGCEAYVWNGLDWEGDYAAPDLSLARRGYHFLGKAARTCGAPSASRDGWANASTCWAATAST